MRKSRSGFTLVELLIVIVVIVILASIVIVAYNHIQGKANDSAVKSDLTNIAKTLEIYKAKYDTYPNPYPGTTLDSYDLQVTAGSYALGQSPVANNMPYCTNSTFTDYAIAAQSKSGNAFMYTSSGGLQDFPGYDAAGPGIAGICTAMLSDQTNRNWWYNWGNGTHWQSWIQNG